MKPRYGILIAISIVIISFLTGPAFAIVPPSDEEAAILRDAPDLQQRIDRANSLLEPLINPETVSPIATAETFAGGLTRYFGLTREDPDFYTGYDLNEDGVIDERDFVELAFSTPALMREACKSPTHGEARCIVLPIKFPDVAPDTGHNSDYWSNMFFGGGTYTTRSYYQQVSDGALDMAGAVLTNPAEPDGYWVADFPKTGYDWDVPYDMALLDETIHKADEIYDFSEYDADGNEEADGVFFIYAGDTDGWGDFYWGWATYGQWIVDGVRVGPLMFVGEHLMTYRVAAHEFGHMMGLPDYYDYTFQSNGIGTWGIMGKGEAYHDARSRYKLGWVDPIPISIDTYGVEFTPRSENGDVYRLWDMGEFGSEFFLLEMIAATGYDYKMPGEGLMIWHVDETRSNNNDWTHKLLDVEEADGNDDLDTKANNGDATDLYWLGNNETFNHETYPNSDTYSGAATAVQVLNVSAVSAGMITADLLIGIEGNLDVEEIEPNDVWNDAGVIPVPEPNEITDGKVDFYSDQSDYWRVTVSKPSVIDVRLDAYNDGTDLSLYLWSLGGGGPVEVTNTTWADEHLRAYVYVPGNHFIEVRAERQASYYDLFVEWEILPDPGLIEIDCTPMLDSAVYDNTETIPAMRLDIYNNAGWVDLQSMQLYTSGSVPSAVESVELWLDNGDEVFGPGLDTLLAGPVVKGGTNQIIINGLDLTCDGYTSVYVVLNLGETGGGGEVGISMLSYKDIIFSGGTVVYDNFMQESGLATIVEAPMPLCYVSAGDFWMGSDPSIDPYYTPMCDYNEETPAHMNRTGNFYISKNEITNGQYFEFMDAGGYETQSFWAAGGWSWKVNNNLTQPEYWNNPDYFIGDTYPDHPIGGISWYESMAYCNYAGGRLPHEAEWEKAGRGTDGRIFSYGNIYNPSICALGYPEPVGSYPASDSIYGVSDLCGNIFEWTYDAWEWGAYQRYSQGSFQPATGSNYKLQRGYRYLIVGDCDQDYATRLSYRDTWPRHYRWSVTGMHVAFDVPD